MYLKMRLEHWRNDIDRGTPNFLEKSLTKCQFEHHKFDKKSPGIEPGHPRGEAGN
jgi:hypothetical protein